MKFNVNQLVNIKKDILDNMTPNTVSSFIEDLKKGDIMNLYNYLPKKSINLHSNCLTAIDQSKDCRSIILISHLYIEQFLEEILKKHSKVMLDYKNLKFIQKLSIIGAMGLIEGKLYQDLRQINIIRNTYAHELYMSDDKLDLSKFSRLNNIYKIKNYKRQKEKSEFNMLILKLQLLLTTTEIFGKFNWLDYIRR